MSILPFSYKTVDNCIFLWYYPNNLIIKGYDEDGKGNDALQRAGGAEIPASGRFIPIPSELRG
ncbi:MAG: hypothetical protein IKH13_06595 [Clostridia bacterium]|nr:hypothetical protein [Clostridia bacterium]